MSEHDIFLAVKAHLDPREWVVIPQVRNQTGFGRRVRTADALAVSCYPSKGIGAHGFEFKDSRGDWLRELKDGSKSEEIGRFCCQWSLVASKPDIVKADEVPEAWGLLVVEDGAVKVRKKAPRREAQEPTWAFFAALMRAASAAIPEADVERRVKEAAAKARSEASAGVYEQIEAVRRRERAEAQKQREEAAAVVREFEEASGVTLERGSWRRGENRRIGETVRLLLDRGPESVREKVAEIARECDRLKAHAERALAELQPTEATCES